MRITLVVVGILLMLVVGGSVAAQPDGWEQIEVDGAVCARGTPYSFFVHAGAADKLMIYFQGGGACWNADTCKEGGTFDDAVTADELSRYQGIFDFNNAANPVADYSVVVVAYCTGDVHTGAGEQRFEGEGGTFSIQFDGFTNAQAVLDWTYTHFEEPSELVITGSSAGAYGALFHAPYILAQYPEAQAVVFGDAGVGVTAPGWDGLETWGTLDNLYDGDAFREVEGGAAFGRTLYKAAAQGFPEAEFAIFTTFADYVQAGFYGLQGGGSDWSAAMLAQIDELDVLDNVSAYVAWGGTHAILPTPLFYRMQVGGVTLRDWFAGLVSGEPLSGETMPSVLCEDCERPELAGG